MTNTTNLSLDWIKTNNGCNDEQVSSKNNTAIIGILQESPLFFDTSK